MAFRAGQLLALSRSRIPKSIGATMDTIVPVFALAHMTLATLIHDIGIRHFTAVQASQLVTILPGVTCGAFHIGTMIKLHVLVPQKLARLVTLTHNAGMTVHASGIVPS